MSLNYQDHQRTRYWRTHGEIYDFRKERVVNRVTIEENREKVFSIHNSWLIPKFKRVDSAQIKIFDKSPYFAW